MAAAHWQHALTDGTAHEGSPPHKLADWTTALDLQVLQKFAGHAAPQALAESVGPNSPPSQTLGATSGLEPSTTSELVGVAAPEELVERVAASDASVPPALVVEGAPSEDSSV